MRQDDEDILPNTKKKEIDIENDQTVLTNDDIWDDFDMGDSDFCQDLLDYCNDY